MRILYIFKNAPLAQEKEMKKFNNNLLTLHWPTHLE